MSHPEPQNIFESLGNCVAFHCRDWSADKRDAWIFGIVCGWDDEAMAEIAKKHRWQPIAVARLKRLRAQFEKFEKVNEPLTGQADKDCSVEGVVELLICPNCINQGWEPHVFEGRVPCSFCNATRTDSFGGGDGCDSAGGKL